MHVLLIDAHATCAELRTNIALRKALVAIIQQQTLEPMQAYPIHCLEHFQMIEPTRPEPVRPQGMNKPRRLDLHRATKRYR